MTDLATGALAPLDYALIGLYLVGMLALGWLVSRGIRHFKDYFLAGGALTTPLLVCTLVSSYYELDVTFATSEQGFHRGVVAWFWWSRPYYIGILIAAFLLARRLRRYDAMTLPDILDHHYGTGARVTGALACLVYSLPITALMGMIAMFEMLGVPVAWGVLVAGGVCLAYTMVGGLWADALTDTVQFALMCVALAVAIPPALALVGGFDGLRAGLPSSYFAAAGDVSPWLIVAWSATALTIFVEPAFYQRILAARDTRSITRALVIGVVLWAAYDWGVTLIGMVARAAVEGGSLPAGLEGRQALVAVFLTTLPVGLKGIFVAGILAAAMSSIDSYSLLASGNLVYDILRPVVGREWSETTLIRFTRLGIALILVPTALLALYFSRISDAWIFMASILAAVAFVPAMAGLFGRPRPRAGLLASAGGLAALALFYFLVHVAGEPFAEEETYVLRVGGIEIWREYAILFALPVSAMAFLVGQVTGRREPRARPGGARA